MIKSNKFYSIRMFVLLCVALVFSCNNITTLEVIKHSKQKLAVPTPSVDGIEVGYGTDLKFSYKVSGALLCYTRDGSVPYDTEPSPVFAAFNGVTAEILDVYGIIPPAGLSVTYYTSVGDGWTYGKANIEWKTNNFQHLFPANRKGELCI